ncbi:hypothetical protein ACFSVK_24520 [Azorhizophilus paspali]|uniref:hypothetical protein n=1 Tax=Azorhizophilus paspali TaxID=69963 RepID=UPI003631210C
MILAVIAALSQQQLVLPTTAYHWGMFLWLAIPASTGAMGLWFAALKIGGSVQTSGFLSLSTFRRLDFLWLNRPGSHRA